MCTTTQRKKDISTLQAMLVQELPVIRTFFGKDPFIYCIPYIVASLSLFYMVSAQYASAFSSVPKLGIAVNFLFIASMACIFYMFMKDPSNAVIEQKALSILRTSVSSHTNELIQEQLYYSEKYYGGVQVLRVADVATVLERLHEQKTLLMSS